MGAATSIIFVTTKVLSWQTQVCHDKHLSWQMYICHDKKYACCENYFGFVTTKHTFCHKSMLVATKLLLWQNYVCRDKTKIFFAASTSPSNIKCAHRQQVFSHAHLTSNMFTSYMLFSWAHLTLNMFTSYTLVFLLLLLCFLSLGVKHRDHQFPCLCDIEHVHQLHSFLKPIWHQTCSPATSPHFKLNVAWCQT